MIEVHAELLFGKRVRDANGVVVGRIRSIAVEKVANECFVKEYGLGTVAFLSRMGIAAVNLFGVNLKRRPRTIPWQVMDLSDPEDPRLKVTLAELEAGAPRA